MKNLLYILFILPILNFGQAARPNAVGHGANVTGGEGYPVYKVTNLNDSGAGSLRDVIGPNRFIVFEIGGRIELQSQLIITSAMDNLTIMGESAPPDSGGITISGAGIRVQSNNFIMTGIRIRVGDNGYKDENGVVQIPDPGTDWDALFPYGSQGGSNMIFDHMSFSWAIDELIGLSGTSSQRLQNVSIINSIMAEPLNCSHHDKGCHGKGAISTYADNITYARNLFTHAPERNIRSGFDVGVEVVNNVFYDFDYGSGISDGNWINIINNYYKGYSPNTAAIISLIPDARSTRATRSYISGNEFDFTSYSGAFVDSDFNPFAEGSPIDGSGLPIMTATVARDYVLASAGVTFPYRDAVDLRAVSDATNRTGDFIDTQEQVGGWPTYAQGTRMVDTDNDGMDDVREAAYFGDLSQTGTGDHDSNGIENRMQMYYDVAYGESSTVAATSVTVTPNTGSGEVGGTTQLTAVVNGSGGNATDQSGVWSSSNESVATVNSVGLVSHIASGSATITFTSNDGSFTDTSSITVTSATSVSGVVVTPETNEVAVAGTVQLTETVSPASAADKTGTWSSSNSSIASVNSSGLVTGMAVSPELLTNGDFSSATGWTIQGESTITGGAGRIYSPTNIYSYLRQSGVMVIGKRYVLEYDVVENNGGELLCGDNDTTNFELSNQVGSYSVEFTATETFFEIKRKGVTDITIDNMSLKEVVDVTFTTTDGGYTDKSRINVTASSNTKGTITLTGASTIYIYEGGVYNDLGATWIDTEDGSGDAVVDETDVNTSVQGTYFVYYNKTDSDGLAMDEVKRTVIVIPTSYGSKGVGNKIKLVKILN